MSKPEPLAVSACLAGVRCRYDGGSRPHSVVQELIARGEDVVLICPEELGGLGTPRPRAALEGGDGEAVWQGQARVMDEHGKDVTEAFCQGARAAFKRAVESGARRAVLKQHSPSCGCHSSRQGGDGVTAALFRRHGLVLCTEEDLLVPESLDGIEAGSLHGRVETEEDPHQH
ncbi:DUF523 domain-containing protein [bacterium CPR1]|nr:DUF523 domain-containing protein [bacterium CPR1]